MELEKINKFLSAEKAPCVSIIVPAHRTAAEKKEDPLALHKAINLAKDALSHQKNDSPHTNTLMENLDQLYKTIDFRHTKDGIGIFVSPDRSGVFHFPFPVKEKVSVGGSFENRELLYYKSIPDYYVLGISRKHIRLFSGKGEDMKEVVNEDFPVDYVETYEYSFPSRGSSYGNSLKEFEKDKSALKEIRFIDFLKTTDKTLGKYLNGSVPLLISGGIREAADYKRITKHLDHIIGRIAGTSSQEKNGLATNSWNFVKKHINEKNDNILNQLNELVGQHTLATGADHVWKAAQEGKGMLLLIEKDIELQTPQEEVSAALTRNSRTGKLHVRNLSDDIIKTVMEKKGKVIFVDNGKLKEFGGVALLLRYKEQHEA